MHPPCRSLATSREIARAWPNRMESTRLKRREFRLAPQPIFATPSAVIGFDSVH
jgi:hypothetical protein